MLQGVAPPHLTPRLSPATSDVRCEPERVTYVALSLSVPICKVGVTVGTHPCEVVVGIKWADLGGALAQGWPRAGAIAEFAILMKMMIMMKMMFPVQEERPALNRGLRCISESLGGGEG